MKYPFLLILHCLIIKYSFGQTTQSGFSIHGTVIDSISKSSIRHLTVILKSIKSESSKSTLTDENGEFFLKKLVKGEYEIVITGTTYQEKRFLINLADTAIQLVEVGDVLMVAKANELDEIVVTATKPIIKQEIDRIIYDMNADPESKNNNLLDMLRRVPLLSLDGEDNILLKGNSNYKILINGRPSSMVAQSPRDILRSMPASSIQKIEVITTPSAKYDSEGLAGIINIITNKKTDQKYKGSIGSYYNYFLGKGMWGNITGRKDRLAVNAQVGRYFKHFLGTTSNSYRTGVESPRYMIKEQGTNNKNTNSGGILTGNIELSYDIDSLNFITAYFTANENRSNQNSTRFFEVYDQDNNLNQSYQLHNNGNSTTRGTDIGINYQLGFKKYKERLFTVSYNNNSSNDNQNGSNQLTNRFNYSDDDLRQINKSGSKEQTLQVDYIHTIKSINIEGGVKAIRRNHYSDFVSESFDIDGHLKPEKTLTDQFAYLQSIYALYNSYTAAWKNWGIKAGLRVELTDIEAEFLKTVTSWNQKYSNFIPSVIIQQKQKNGSINFGYTQRIQRPGIVQLNPFVNKSNPLLYTSGNPSLLPVLNHSFELSYRYFKKGFINISLDYSFANNAIQNVIIVEDSINRSSFENVGKTDNVGVNVNFNYPINNKMNVNFNGRASHLWVEGIFNGKMYRNEGFQGNVSSTFSYVIAEGFRTSVSLFGNGAVINLQGNTNPNFFNSFSISKNLFQKKISVTGQLYNPFQKYRHTIDRLNTISFIQVSDVRSYHRGFYINAVYNFGNLKDGVKKNKRGINNDDVENPK